MDPDGPGPGIGTGTRAGPNRDQRGDTSEAAATVRKTATADRRGSVARDVNHAGLAVDLRRSALEDFHRCALKDALVWSVLQNPLTGYPSRPDGALNLAPR
jgi:hypothetical protein